MLSTTPQPHPAGTRLRDEIFTVKVNYNQWYHAVCTWSSCSPAREFSLFSETAQLGWVEEVKVRGKGWNGVGLQLTRPTVLLNEIITFGWHLFTNSCTQIPLAQKGQVVRAFSVVRPKIYLSRAIGRVGISSPAIAHWTVIQRKHSESWSLDNLWSVRPIKNLLYLHCNMHIFNLKEQWTLKVRTCYW